MTMSPGGRAGGRITAIRVRRSRVPSLGGLRRRLPVAAHAASGGLARGEAGRGGMARAEAQRAPSADPVRTGGGAGVRGEAGRSGLARPGRPATARPVGHPRAAEGGLACAAGGWRVVRLAAVGWTHRRRAVSRSPCLRRRLAGARGEAGRGGLGCAPGGLARAAVGWPQWAGASSARLHGRLPVTRMRGGGRVCRG